MYFHKKILSSCFQYIIMKDVSWSPNQYIKTISEESSGTEDWKCNFAIIGIDYLFECVKKENSYFKL